MDAGEHQLGHAGAGAEPCRASRCGSIRWLGLAVVVGICRWATSWYGSADEKLAARAIIVLAGFAMGFIMHRSRFCFARAFREPFMTAEGDMTKAMILALAVGIPVASLMFQDEADRSLSSPSRRRFWLGSLLGGVVFGLGMVFAGGCASGSLWRVGEGHLKLWVAVFFFAWVGSIASALFNKTGLTVAEMNLDMLEESPLGIQAFFPTCSAAGAGPISPSAPCCCCGICWCATTSPARSSRWSEQRRLSPGPASARAFFMAA